MGTLRQGYAPTGNPQENFTKKSDAASLTVKTESVLLTAVEETGEGRDVAVVDIPGSFLNAFLEEVVHMRLEGVVADALIMLAPEV